MPPRKFFNFRPLEIDSGAFWDSFPAWQGTHTNRGTTCTRRTIDRLSEKLRQNGRADPNPPQGRFYKLRQGGAQAKYPRRDSANAFALENYLQIQYKLNFSG